MGLWQSSCMSKDERASVARSRLLDQELKQAEKEEQKVLTVLLFGLHQVGKSTVFEQLMISYGPELTDHEKVTFQSVVHRTALLCIQKLCRMSELLSQLPHHSSTRISDSVRHSLVALRVAVQNAKFGSDFTILPPLAAHIEALWHDAGVQRTYQLRHTMFGFAEYFEVVRVTTRLPAVLAALATDYLMMGVRAYDPHPLSNHAAYFLDKVIELGQPSYIPSVEDSVRARERLSAITEQEVTVRGHRIRFIDFEMQLGDRRKWISQFEGVDAILFVVSLADVEEEKSSPMEGSLYLFETICNSRYFQNTEIVLLFNKSDVFEEKVSYRSMVRHFPSYADYLDDHKQEHGMAASMDFFRKEFESRNYRTSNRVYSFATCATDTRTMKVVLSDVLSILERRTIVREDFADFPLYG